MQLPGGFYMMLVIFGPTTTGKTALSIKLSKLLNGEVISADSRQVYRGLDVGSGKVGPDDKIDRHKDYWAVNGIKIHGFDIREPGTSFSAADFITYAKHQLTRITRLKKIPIIAGGTGFYIKAFLDGIETAGVKPNLNLRSELEKLTAGELFEKLLLASPEKAKSLNESDRQNPRRLVRAIEIALSDTPSVLSSQNHRVTPGENQNKEVIVIGLTAPNEYLYKRADIWLKKRLKLGLVKEVESLIKKRISPRWLEDLGLEYRWTTRYLQGKISYDTAIERLKGDIHSYIRRQKTFFNQFNNLQMYDISQENWQEKLDMDLKRLLGRE